MGRVYEAAVAATLRSDIKGEREAERQRRARDPNGAAAAEAAAAEAAAADGKLARRWRGTLHVDSLEELKDAELYDAVVIWHDTDFSRPPDPRPPFKPIADYFNIWHEWERTAHADCLHQVSG